VAISTPPIRILVCDDDKAICDYVETLLTRDGHDVKTVSDPLLVEDEVKNGHYQMLILDRMMPKMDGIEVLRRVRKADNDISVIMFTGFPSLDSAVAAMKLAADDYLKKPFNAEELREVIDRIAKKKGIVRSPEEQLHNVIGETIRRLRKEKDLTLKQMAHRTGLSVSLLSQIERAESSASIPSLYKIATALGTRVSELFGGY
jgi:two-component system, OmpR family, response regulator